ncbi:MAG: TetR/AcrR family transcriptional regulator [Marmoricola sp.]|nr:TetR/AcrR family transcriptional regulator [Marmoricola sp.]
MTSPAKTYHHGHLREALIDAATDLARTGGPEAVVLREVARQVGVSHNAAYRHFTDRDELLGEVGARAMDQLGQAMKRGIEGVRARDPAKRSRGHLDATGRAYVEFALANPGLFGIAFAGVVAADAQEVSLTTDPYAVLNEVLDSMVESGAMPASRRPGADATCWAGVHGFAVLHLGGGLDPPLDETWRSDLEHLLSTLDRGLCAP